MLANALAALFTLVALGTEPESAAPPVQPAVAAEPASTSPALREPLREIGRVRVMSDFCKAFLTHFNGSARAMLGNDQTLTFVDFTLGGLESHFKSKGGELVLYDDRVRLIHYSDEIFKSIGPLQGEIDELRRSAELSKDPQQAKDAREAAAELQKSLDRQHAMALDSLGVVHALMELALGQTSDLPLRSKAGGPPSIGVPEVSGPSASTNYTGSVAANSDYTQSTPEQRRDVRSYLQFDKQFDKIGRAESAAIQHAQSVADRC